MSVVIDGENVNVTYVITDDNDDGEHEIGTDDLTKATKTTLGDYLKQDIQENKLVYQYPAITMGDGGEEIQLSYNPSYTPSIEPLFKASPGMFTSDGGEDGMPWAPTAKSYWDGPADPSYSYNAEGDPLINKNKRDLKGDTILARMRGLASAGTGEKVSYDHPLATSLQARISEVLETNRFSPGGDSPFIQDGSTEQWIAQKDPGVLGKYQPNQSSHVTWTEMQQLVYRMMLNATGHDEEGGDKPASLKPTGDATDLDVPTYQQMGMERVSLVDLNVKVLAQQMGILPVNVPLSIPDSSISLNHGVVDGDDSDLARFSWGVLNSPDEPFNSPFPSGMILLCLTSLGIVLGLAYLIQILGMIITWDNDVIGKGNAGNPPIDPSGPKPNTWSFKKRIYGEHVPRSVDSDQEGFNFSGFGNKLLELLGIPATHHGWTGCFSSGIEAFYGFAEGGMSDLFGSTNWSVPDMEGLTDGAVNIIEASGYYASVMRSTVRDITQITESIEDAASSPGVSSVIGVLKSLITSATWKWMMVMMTIGDKVLDDKSRFFAIYPWILIHSARLIPLSGMLNLVWETQATSRGQTNGQCLYFCFHRPWALVHGLPRTLMISWVSLPTQRRRR